MGLSWQRISHWRRGILGVFALLAVLAIAGFIYERVTNSGGREAERTALSAYVEALRPAFKINVTMTTRVLTVPDSATGKDYTAVYREAEKEYSRALAIVTATKPPKEMAAGHKGVAEGFRAYMTMFRQAADLMEHLMTVEHTDAEAEQHRVEMEGIFEKGYGVTSARRWATDIAKDYERRHLDPPQWFTDFATQMKKVLGTTESPQP